MSWQDCFVLGQHLYTMRDFNNTVPWLEQSMRLLAKQSYSQEPVSLDFMETVMGYHESMGDYQNALNLINHVLTVQPEQRLHLLETRTHLEQLISDGVKRGLMHEVARSPDDYHITREYLIYQQVCREELKPTAAAQRDLHCRFYSGHGQRLTYLRYKLEVLHLDPYIIQVHEVISAPETVELQHVARPELQRSQVYSPTNNQQISANFRTSQGTTFQYEEHPIMKRLSQHMTMLSGLDMRFAEPLQIANYGIGGHYEPHMDSLPDSFDYSSTPYKTNRLATGIFYVSVHS